VINRPGKTGLFLKLNDMKTPLEKALQLMTRFQETSYKLGDHSSIYTPTAKHHALICVDEVLHYAEEHGFIGLTEYWNEVKHELENL